MPTFAAIWDHHPNVTGEDPLLDKATYENQCAINLYAALQRAGVNVSTFTGQLSWQKDRPKYAIRAQEVADWLASPAKPLPSKIEKFGGKDAIYARIGSFGLGSDYRDANRVWFWALP